MRKRLFLITGTTSGLGLETAKRLAAMNVHLVLAVRNTNLAEEQAKKMREDTGNHDIDVLPLDLSSLSSIKSFEKELINRYDYLDVLINNAGVFCDSKKKTTEGFEMTMGVNFVGNYYLTTLLLPFLKKGNSPRIVNIVSKAGYFGQINVKEHVFKNHPHGFRAYSASKLCQIYMNIYLSEQLEKDRITVNAVHPGEVATGIWKGDSLLMKLIAPINKKRYTKPEVACETILYVATSKDLDSVTGKLYENTNQQMTYNKRILNKEKMNQVINYTNELLLKTKF
jgi:NAD(P)-dependent dehydrogenase (short-subunit alcohol dehydrogenase family)